MGQSVERRYWFDCEFEEDCVPGEVWRRKRDKCEDLNAFELVAVTVTPRKIAGHSVEMVGGPFHRFPVRKNVKFVLLRVRSYEQMIRISRFTDILLGGGGEACTRCCLCALGIRSHRHSEAKTSCDWPGISLLPIYESGDYLSLGVKIDMC